jgi:replicative DNA helicase
MLKPTLSRTIRSLKLAAKKLSVSNYISYSQALDSIAEKEGFVSWSLLSQHNNSLQVKTMHELCQHIFQAQSVLLAARPNVGKVSLAINLSLLAAKSNNPVIYFSFSTSKKAIQEKLAAANSAIAHSQFAKSDLRLEESNSIKNSLNEISKLPIKIYDSIFSIEEIKKIICDKVNRNGFIVIDYMQLIKCDTIETAVFELKSSAKINKVNLLFISQLNDTNKKINTKISLDDLCGGKELARHCDWVLGLHRDHVYDSEADPKKAKINVLKSHINSLKRFEVNFDPSTGICSW